MDIIQVNNNTYMIRNDADLVDAINQECGYELSRLVEQKLDSASYEEQLAEKQFNSDFFAYESQVESLGFCLQDVLQSVEELINYVDDSKKINRTVITDKLRYIKRLINSEI